MSARERHVQSAVDRLGRMVCPIERDDLTAFLDEFWCEAQEAKSNAMLLLVVWTFIVAAIAVAVVALAPRIGGIE